MRGRRVRRFAALAAVTAGSFAPAAGSEAATSDDLWAAFDEASARHAAAAEQLAALELSLEDLDARLAADEARVRALEDGVRELAVWAYVRAGVDDDLSGLVDPGQQDVWAADYADQVIGSGTALIGDLSAARSDLAAERANRDTQAAQLEQILAELGELRTDLQERAIAARAAEDEAARLAAEAAARAEAEAAAAAAAAATSTTAAPDEAPGVTAPSAPATSTATTAPAAASPAPATTAPAAPAPTTPKPTGGIHTFDGAPTDAQLLVLRTCESGDNYANKRNPRYRGAYQFAWRTWDAVAARQGWHDLVGVDPADAHPTSQDSMVRALYATNGWRPWPVCGQRASAA